MDFQDFEDGPVDATTKGIPWGAPVVPSEAALKGWNLLEDDLPYPVLVLREPALEHNLTAMAGWCRAHGVLLAPHAKTTLCPRIWKRQMALGAWGLTVATAHQATLCVRAGARRVLIANQLVGRENVRAVVAAMNADAGLETYCLVDSIEGAEHLAACARRTGARRPLRVLLEVGRRGWRTGVRSLDEARAVASAVGRRSDVLELAGVEGFEGLADPGEPAQVRTFLEDLQGTADDLFRSRPGPPEGPLLSLGGSAYLDHVHEFLKLRGGPMRVVVRSGCTVTSDHGVYAGHLLRARGGGISGTGFPDLRPALELWSMVQSVRDGATAILTFGRRDCPYDAGLPIPLFRVAPGGRRADARPLAGARITRLNDQHAFMSLPEGERPEVGDRVACGISHPCTAFDKWSVIPLLDAEDRVIDLYRTCL